MRKNEIAKDALVEITDKTFAPKHGKEWWLSFLARLISVVLIGIAISPLYLGTLPAEASHGGVGLNPGPEVTPENPPGNPKCHESAPSKQNEDLEGPGQTWLEAKRDGNIDDPVGTTYTVTGTGGFEARVTVTGVEEFEWSSNMGVDGVLVKGGQGGPNQDNNFYRYDNPTYTTTDDITATAVPPGELTGDDDLTIPEPTPGKISHIAFCYDIEVLPDLTITKSASKTSVEPGETFNFFVTVTNIGAATATTVTISDNLDDRLTGVTATYDNNPGSAGGTDACSVGAGNTVTCSIGDLAPSSTANQADTARVTISATAPADACDQITNTASTSAGNTESSTSNNTSNQITVDIVCANVTILKTAPQSPVNAGDVATFTILVSSTGETTATSVTVSDTLPSGITWTDDSADCTVSGNLLTCTYGSLGPGATRTVNVTGTTDAADCGTITNTAVVTATNEPASNQGDNSSSASIEVQCGDLQIQKSSDNPSINAGDPIGFSILVTNTGLGSATGVRVTDTLPPGFDWAEDPENADCSIAVAVLTCNFGTMAPSATRSVHVSSGTDPADCAIVTNTAEVGSSNDGSDSSTATVTINCPDMEIQKDGNGPISAGQTATFTILVTNTGLGVAASVSVTDTLPAGITWTTTTPGCSVTNGNELSCFFGDLAPAATRTVTVSGMTDAADCKVLENIAFVSSTNEANTTNNSDPASIEVRCPDVTVLKDGNGPISAGQTATFTLVVSNTGSGEAQGVTLTDVLPPGVSWTLSGPDAGACGLSFAGGSDVLTCNFGDLDPGETRTVTVSGVTDSQDCGELANTATVGASNEPVDAPDPNQSSDSITVLCPDLEIQKDGNGPINAGDTAVFTIVVTNTGAGVAVSVSVTDTLPSGVSWGTTTPGCAIANGNELTCNFGDLDPGETRTVTVSGKVAADDCGVLNNIAFVTSTNEANAANNSDSASIDVLCANIDISKIADSATINAGDQIGFSILVADNGTGTAYDVQVTDTLPAGFSWDMDPDNSDCDLTGDLLTCDFGTMTAGATRTVHVVSPTDPVDCAVVTNTAEVGTSNDGSDSSTATVTINCPDMVIQKDGNGPISAGQTATFTILVTNTGLGVAASVSVTDTLPPGITWTTTTPGCSVTNGNELSCNFGDLAPGETRTVTVSGITDAADCGTLNNTAYVSSTNEANTTNNSDSASIQVDCPDVTVLKDGNGPISAGDTAIFTIVVTNTGAGEATGVTLTDVLPPGINWTETDDPSNACSITFVGGSDVLTCNFGTIPAGETRTVTVSGVSDSQDCGELSNTATVSASNEPANAPNPNQSSDSITVLCPDLVIQKDGNGPINAGDTAVFTIVVTNTGAGVAVSVSVTDTLPSGVSWGTTTPGCAIANGNELTCDFGTMTAGATRTVTVSGETDSADCPALNNTATVSASNESNTSNNSDTASITINCPDLVIQKDGNGPINAGDQAVFTIVVTNTGSGDAYNVFVTDTLPSGVTWTDDSDDCSITDGVLTCDFGTMTAGSTRTVTVFGDTDSADCPALNNTATVSASNESNTSNNSDTASITVNCAEIEILKTEDDDVVNAGDQIGFTIVVSNTGSGSAYNVLVTDTLPARFTWTESPDNAECSIDGSGVLTCNFQTMTAGASETVHVVATSDADDCRIVTNTAEVGTSNDGTDSSTATVTINCPDLVIQKDGNGPISAGDTAVFTIVVTNTGSGDGYNVFVTDTLPSGVTWTDDSDDCSITDGVLTCDFGTMTAGATRTVTVSGETDSADCGVLNNTATVTASNEGANITSNNADTASITVNCPDVTVLKLGNGTISAGDTATFTIVVSNTGSGEAKDVTLTDALPSGVSWTLSGPDAGDCNISFLGVLVCNFGDLAPGATRTVTVAAITKAQDCGELANTATVFGSNEPANAPDPNQSSDSITVLCPDLVIQKDGNGPISAGDEAVFTIVVTNTGAGVAVSVSVTDTLPAGISWGTATPGCSIANGNELTCNFGDLAPGETRTVTVSGVAAADDCGSLNNTAFVSALNEANAQNNSDGASIDVLCADIDISKQPDSATINAGDQIGFSILVANNGTGTAHDVRVTDTLPAGFGWLEDPDNLQCSIAGDLLTCNFGSMTAGATRTVHVVSPTDPSDCAVVTNTAEVGTSNDGSGSSTATVTINCADVTIAKVGNGPINAGDQAIFTIVVTNTGAGDAYNVLVTDTLPSGVDWSEGSGDCSISGGVLTCNFGTMTAGTTRTVTVSGPTDSSDCEGLFNQAEVASSNDTNIENNFTDAEIAVLCAEIAISKSADAAAVSAGDQIGFTILVTNNGPGSAYGVRVTDTLPSGFSWTEDPDNADCTIATQVLTCNFGTMTAGATRTVHVVSPTDPADCGLVTNTAEVGTSNDGSASADARLTIDCPALVIQKDGNGTINAGDEAVFTIVVTNTGSGVAKTVTVTDTLPAGVSWVDDSGACDVTGGNQLSCNFGDLGPGETRTVTVSGLTDSGDCQGLNNTAFVSASNASGSSDVAFIAVNCPAIDIQKSADSGTVNAGDQIGFTILVTNNGPGSASTVTVTDTLPAGFSWTESPDNTDCTILGNDLNCDFGTMAAGTTETVHVVATSTAADCGRVTNTAHVSSSNDDPSASTADMTINCPDLVVQKDGNGTISAGDTAVFTIVVTNNGAGLAKDVSVTDTLPAGISWSEDSLDCTITGSSLECAFGDLGPGATRTVTVSGQTDPADCGVLNNTAFVASSNEADTQDNSDSASITVLCAVIDITKTADSGSVIAGDPIGFTLLIANDGDGRADGVTVTDTLPANGGLAWDIDGGTGAEDCSITLGLLTCNFGSMTPGATRTVHISSPTTAQSCGTVNNTGFVTTSNDGSDSDSESITVTCPNLGIVIVKTVTPDSGVPGTEVVYTYVVTNTGEATLFNISVDDDKLGHIGDITQLTPGQSATLVKPSVLGTVGVTNIGTAVGTDRLGRTVSDTDDASVSVVSPLTIARPAPAPAPVAPKAIAKTGIELWPPMLSAFLMILLGSACLRGGRVRPKGEYNWEFESHQ